MTRPGTSPASVVVPGTGWVRHIRYQCARPRRLRRISGQWQAALTLAQPVVTVPKTVAARGSKGATAI